MSTARRYSLLVFVIGVALLPRSELLPTAMAYVLVTASSIAVALAFLSAGDQSITVHKWLGVLFLVVYLLIMVQPLPILPSANTTVNEVVRALVFLSITPVFLFLLPSVFSVEDFFGVLSRISAGIVIIGLPTAVVGTYSLFGVAVTPHIWGFNLPLFGLPSGSVNPITSIMDNPNSFGFVASVAFAGGLVEIENSPRSVAAWAFLSINFVGAYLSGSRAAAGALAICLGIYTSYKIFDARMTSLFIFITGISFVYLLVISLTSVSGPHFVPAVNLRGRDLIWTAIWEASLEQPLLGHGLGEHSSFYREYIAQEMAGAATHSSYLRMLLTTGFVGAIAYLLLTISVIRSSFRTAGPAKIGLVAATTVIAFHQVWVGFSIFGLATQSVLSAVVFGYVITESGVAVTSISTTNTQPSLSETSD